MSELQPGRYLWPAGHRAALCLTFDVDGLYGEANYQPASNTYAISQAEYDRTGIDRILRILADADVTATFCWVGQRRRGGPEVVRCGRRGRPRDRASHVGSPRLQRDEPRRAARRHASEASMTLERITGSRSRRPQDRWLAVHGGYLRARAGAGLRWVMDEPGGDAPVLHAADPICHRWCNCRRRGLGTTTPSLSTTSSPRRHTFEFWREDLDVIRDEGGLMCLTMHPFVSGRPGPSRALAA